jgi:vacuolar protein sorting-associated protein 13A/C
LSLDVRAHKHTHILSITHYHPERSVYKPKGYKPSTFDSLDTIASGVEAFEAMHEDASPTLTLTLECAGIGLSLVNRKLVEVIYISVDALKLEYTDSRAAQTISVSCGWLQIDNQLHEALYPVILQPTPIPRDSSEAAAPTVQGSLICLKDRGQVI